ncbi:MAG TPA: phosphatase PAP2 family protein [Limnochordales bacterium]
MRAQPQEAAASSPAAVSPKGRLWGLLWSLALGGGPGGPLAARLAGAAVQAAGMVVADELRQAAASEDGPDTGRGLGPDPGSGGSGSPAGVLSDTALAAGLLGLAAAAYARDGTAGSELVASAGEALVASAAWKLALGRARPYQGLGPYTLRPFLATPGQAAQDGRPLLGARWDSLPSTHASVAWAAARSLARHLPDLALPAYGWALYVSMARAAEGRHWPSDLWLGAELARELNP